MTGNRMPCSESEIQMGIGAAERRQVRGPSSMTSERQFAPLPTIHFTHRDVKPSRPIFQSPHSRQGELLKKKKNKNKVWMRPRVNSKLAKRKAIQAQSALPVKMRFIRDLRRDLLKESSFFNAF